MAALDCLRLTALPTKKEALAAPTLLANTVFWELDEGATATAAATLEDEQTTATPDAMIDCRPSRFQKCPLYAYLTTSCITR
jgi:hypothetical protein